MYRQKLLILILMLMFAVSVNSFAAETWSSFIEPELKVSLNAGSALQQYWNQYCETGDGQFITQSQEQWVTLASHWIAFQSLASRRLDESFLSFKLWFWPDKKNLIGKKTQQFLASNEYDSFQAVPAPAQGLGAIEYFLYEAPPNSNSFECRNALAIVNNFNQNILNISSAALTPADEDLSFQVNALANLVANADKRVSSYHREEKAENKYGMDGWRSLSQQQLLAAQLALGSKLTNMIANHHSSANTKNLLTQITKTMQVNQAPWSFENSIKLSHQIHKVQESLSKELAPSLNVTLGFNNSDGD